MKKIIYKIIAVMFVCILSLGALIGPNIKSVGAEESVQTYEFKVLNKIYGKTTQDGVPTPVNPVPVKGLTSVKDTVDGVLYNIPIIDTDGKAHTLHGFGSGSDYIDVSTGKLYKQIEQKFLSDMKDFTWIRLSYVVYDKENYKTFVEQSSIPEDEIPLLGNGSVQVFSTHFKGVSNFVGNSLEDNCIFTYGEPNPDGETVKFNRIVIKIDYNFLGITDWDSLGDTERIAIFKNWLSNNTSSLMVYVKAAIVEYDLSAFTMAQLLTYDTALYNAGLPDPELIPLSVPQVKIDKDGFATWSAVENAVKYVYSINGGEGIETTELSVQLALNDYIQVKALTDNELYTNSPYSSLLRYEKKKAIEDYYLDFTNWFGDITGIENPEAASGLSVIAVCLLLFVIFRKK